MKGSEYESNYQLQFRIFPKINPCVTLVTNFVAILQHHDIFLLIVLSMQQKMIVFWGFEPLSRTRRQASDYLKIRK